MTTFCYEARRRGDRRRGLPDTRPVKTERRATRPGRRVTDALAAAAAVPDLDGAVDRERLALQLHAQLGRHTWEYIGEFRVCTSCGQVDTTRPAAPAVPAPRQPERTVR